MINKKTLDCLEFNKILEEISNKAFSEKAKNIILRQLPSYNISNINDKLSLLDECVRLNFAIGKFPIRGYYEIKEECIRAQKEATLQGEAFLKIAATLRCAKQVKHFIVNYENISLYPNIEQIAKEIEPLSNLEKEISGIILDATTISDDATNELYSIRKEIKHLNDKIKEKLQNIIHSSQNKKILQEAIVTMRLGRYVIPVKAEAQNQIKGIVHDTSSSGITVYIEPMAIVTLNNKLRELEVKENEEILRILKRLSLLVKDNSSLIIQNEETLTHLDVLLAKSEYAIENECNKPNIVNEKIVDLKMARHPLIEKEKAVSSDIIIGSKYTSLIITGPNTGGKTVTLKTLGLAILMAQSGLFIFAKENSRLGVFKKVFADIGDEQSIAQSLSTFSSHMTNIVRILEEADEDSLILLDELGAGTDPTEGAALACTILDYFREKGAIVLATTHYSEIKEYAMLTKGVLNASVEFDVNTLRPTYKLIIGIPGKSNAFEISRRLGLKEEILEKADSYITRENKEFEDLIKELSQKVAFLDSQKEEYNKLISENKSINEQLNNNKKDFEGSRDKIILQASLEGKRLISEAKEESKKIVEELKAILNEEKVNSNKKNAKKKMDEALNRIKSQEEILNSHIPIHEINLKVSDEKVKADFKVGDDVYIPSLDKEATILGFNDEKNVFVQIGIVKTKLNISKLRPLNKAKENTKKVASSFQNQKALNISTKLDLRGMLSDDAILKMEKYIDDALLANLNTITIIHGKGTGALRKAVTEELRKHPSVKSFRIGGLNEGAEGATIVTLK